MIEKQLEMEELQREVAFLRQRVSELEKSEARSAQQEKAFENLKEKYSLLCEEGPLCYQSLDNKGCFLSINQKWLDTLGYSSEEVIGRRFDEFMTPDYKQSFWVNFPRFKKSGRVRGVEFELVMKDGSTRFMTLMGMVDYDTNGQFIQTHCLLQDITDRKLAEVSLKESTSNFRELYEITDDIILVLALDGEIIYANRSASKKLGYDQDRLRSMNILNLYPDEFRDRATKLLLGEERPSAGDCSIPMLTANGATIEVETRIWHSAWSGKESLFTVSRDITQQRESLQKFNTFFYRNPCPMTVTILPERTFVEANEAFLGTLGYSIDEVIGKTSAELGIFMDEDAVLEMIRQLRETGSVKKMEMRVRSKNGDILYGLFSGEVIKLHGSQYFLSAMLGITELKRSQEALAKSEARFRNLAELLPQGVFECDTSGKFTYVNRAFKSILGFKPEDDLLGLDPSELVIPEERPRTRYNVQKVLGGRVLELREYVALRKDGEFITTLVNAAPISRDGEIVGFRATVTDISPLKESERERAELQSQLFQAQKLASLGTLVGGIAHDFNNMLQAIIGYGEILRDNINEGKNDTKSLAIILKTSQEAADLVRKFMAIGQKSVVTLKPIDLNDKIRELESQILGLPNIDYLGLDLLNQPATIRQDEDQLGQVIMNLATNASEAMPNGGQLRLSTTKVVLGEDLCKSHIGAGSGPYVLLTVSDTGRGMDEVTSTTRLFDPFFSTKEPGNIKGMGLGLPVARGIVQQQGGFITCESVLGQGTTFRVYFPEMEIPAKPVTNDTAGCEMECGKAVLIVDDSELVASLEQTALEAAGYDVIMASDGRQAVNIYSKKHADIGLVILDIIMHGMNGRECVMELLKINPLVKIIVLTGHDPKAELSQAVRPYVMRFLPKPCKMTQLIEVVQLVLEG